MGPWMGGSEFRVTNRASHMSEVGVGQRGRRAQQIFIHVRYRQTRLDAHEHEFDWGAAIDPFESQT